MITPFALTGGTLLFGDAAGTDHQDWTVVVDSTGTITQAGPSGQIEIPAELVRIDATRKFVIPGLINAHAHLFADGTVLAPILTKPATKKYVAWAMRSPAGSALVRKRTRTNLRTQLHSGVTTLRSVGDVGYEVVQAGAAIERGEQAGPRVFASGPLMAITDGHGAPQIAHICDTPEQARAHTRAAIRSGVSAIKIAATAGVSDAKEIGYAGKPEMPEASMREICREAHDAGILVAAHAQSAEGVAAALRAGVDTIEHGQLQVGDVLLMRGAWDALERKAGHSGVLSVDDPDLIRRQSVRLGVRSYVAVGVLVLMCIVLALELLPPAIVVMIAAVVLVVSRVLSFPQAQRAISLTTIVVVAGMIPLSTAIQTSGAADLISDSLVAAFGESSPRLLLVCIVLIVMVLGQFLSNLATVLIVAPVAVAVAGDAGVSPLPMMMGITIAGAASFLTPVATPGNLMVQDPGAYRFGDYWKLGLVCMALYFIIATVLVPIVWPF